MRPPNLAVRADGLAAERPSPSLASVFLAFLKMGAFAFGGVYSMLSLFQRELVDRRRWLSEEEFAEGVAIGQMTPGPPVVNTGIFVGYRLGGVRGAVAATAGQVLPGFVLVLALAGLYVHVRSSPAVGGALKGIAAAVVGLLGSVVVRMARKVVRGRRAGALAVAAFALLAFGHANPMLLIALAGASGWLLFGRDR